MGLWMGLWWTNRPPLLPTAVVGVSERDRPPDAIPEDADVAGVARQAVLDDRLRAAMIQRDKYRIAGNRELAASVQERIDRLLDDKLRWRGAKG